MSQHWIDRDKHKAVDGFKAAQNRQGRARREQQNKPLKPQAPQLVPKRSMRSVVEAKVREQRAAELSKRKVEIEEKLSVDRTKGRVAKAR